MGFGSAPGCGVVLAALLGSRRRPCFCCRPKYVTSPATAVAAAITVLAVTSAYAVAVAALADAANVAVPATAVGAVVAAVAVAGDDWPPRED